MLGTSPRNNDVGYGVNGSTAEKTQSRRIEAAALVSLVHQVERHGRDQNSGTHCHDTRHEALGQSDQIGH